MMTLFLYGVLADNLTYILGEIQTDGFIVRAAKRACSSWSA